ncbi:AbrB/MazE/SpoVT family DNA-binding domain-containing protein [Ligilactobacillus equi]|uniref:Transcriptional regulator/antitoxin, MazE n=2 Tax=Ligilactobacillus equi TaxID=137357 RepID=V7HYR9_9LACO|nr:AbrB/MazE/SpoVT family DNA-binding domain-containing protein [Ligilactobacillus equi]ETA75032.1 transcriptional regulator/antitoxin, MazE [Ligilactobacillus equi DPC 6820]
MENNEPQSILSNVSKWGSSLGIRIPMKIAQQVGIKLSDVIQFSELDGGIFVQKITSQYPLISEMEPYFYFESGLDGFNFHFKPVDDAKDDIIFKTFYGALDQNISIILLDNKIINAKDKTSIFRNSLIKQKGTNLQGRFKIDGFNARIRYAGEHNMISHLANVEILDGQAFMYYSETATIPEVGIIIFCDFSTTSLNDDFLATHVEKQAGLKRYKEKKEQEIQAKMQEIFDDLKLMNRDFLLGRNKWTVRSNVDSSLNIQIRSSLGEQSPGKEKFTRKNIKFMHLLDILFLTDKEVRDYLVKVKF